VSPEAGGDVDLAELLDVLAGSHVAVSAPGWPVWVSARVGHEIASAVRSALDNTATHAGAEARAWVLVEEAGDEVVVSVRDDGPGIVASSLDQADAEGRMGVSRSIRGRISAAVPAWSPHPAWGSSGSSACRGVPELTHPCLNSRTLPQRGQTWPTSPLGFRSWSA
jgi:hypothetical protein